MISNEQRRFYNIAIVDATTLVIPTVYLFFVSLGDQWQYLSYRTIAMAPSSVVVSQGNDKCMIAE
jgi:hypothetical protein